MGCVTTFKCGDTDVSDYQLWDIFPNGIHFIDFEKTALEQAIDNLTVELGVAAPPIDRDFDLRPLIRKQLKDKSLVFILDGIKSIYDVEGFLDIINPKSSFLIASTRHKINQADQSRLYLDQLEIPEQFSLDEAQSAIFNIQENPLQVRIKKYSKTSTTLFQGCPWLSLSSPDCRPLLS